MVRSFFDMKGLEQVVTPCNCGLRWVQLCQGFCQLKVLKALTKSDVEAGLFFGMHGEHVDPQGSELDKPMRHVLHPHHSIKPYKATVPTINTKRVCQSGPCLSTQELHTSLSPQFSQPSLKSLCEGSQLHRELRWFHAES